MGSSGAVMPCWDAANGLRVGVAAAEARMGMGTTVFDKRAPFSLIAAMKAGTRTGLGNWAMGRGSWQVLGITMIFLTLNFLCAICCKEFDGGTPKSALKITLLYGLLAV